MHGSQSSDEKILPVCRRVMIRYCMVYRRLMRLSFLLQSISILCSLLLSILHVITSFFAISVISASARGRAFPRGRHFRNALPDPFT